MAVRMYATGSVLTLKDDSWNDEKYFPHCNLEVNGNELTITDYVSKSNPDYTYDFSDFQDESGVAIGDLATVKSAIQAIIFA